MFFLGLFVLLDYKQNFLRSQGLIVLSHLDVVIFVTKTYCSSWVLLRCSGILCIISPVYVGIIICISPAFPLS